MKQYPSIDKIPVSGQVYAFDKKDGSQVRAEWNRKNGFFRWGRRHGLLDDSTPILLQAPEIFQASGAGTVLDRAFRKERIEACTVFAEFWGSLSFAGNHDLEDAHFVSVFDVFVERKGQVPPRDFIRLTADLDGVPHGRAQLLHYGNANSEFLASVRDGTLPGMTFEGVVCKSPGRHGVDMFKVKSQAWLSRLKEKCKDDLALYEMLA